MWVRTRGGLKAPVHQQPASHAPHNHATSVRLLLYPVILHTLTGFSSSTDVDECVTNTHSCGPSERCVNTVGSFVCELQVTCPAGYQLRNSVCEGELIVPGVFH